MPNVPISYPARYAPGVALNYSDGSGDAILVSQAAPLPVSISAAPSGSAVPTPLTGTAQTARTVGSFVPVAARPILLTLSGTWTGTARLLRSIDGGVTRLPVTLAGAPWGEYTANINEPVWEENEAPAVFYLQLTPLSGSIVYRLAQ